MQLVFIENNRPVTDSLTVAETFGKEHRRVLQDIRELGCSAEFRMHHFVHTPYIHPQNGQTYEKCFMTQEGFAFLAFGYTGKEADRFKEDYINEFVKMRDKLNKPAFHLPQTMPEALRLLASEMEDKQRIAAEKQVLELQTAEQNRQLTEQAPKVAFANMVVAAGNTQPMGTVAKAVGMGRNNLFKFLRDKGVIMRTSTLPYQQYIDRGYFIVREVPVRRGDDLIVNEPAARVTAKGLEYIAKLVLENQGA
jgi:anti-repressor protein